METYKLIKDKKMKPDKENKMSKLQEFRKSKGLTQEEFARVIGYTLSLTAKVEIGTAKPSRAFMERIKEVYPDADINALFFEKGSLTGRGAQ